MLRFVIKKMLSNRWMVLCQLIGFVLAVAMVSSIPMYTNGILQKMLVRNLENFQKTRNKYPGDLLIKMSIRQDSQKRSNLSHFLDYDEKIKNHMVKAMDLPVLSQSMNFSLQNLRIFPEIQKSPDEFKRTVKFNTLSSLDKHISITNGRLFSGKAKDGIFEIMVTQETMKSLHLVLDDVYLVYNDYDKTPLPFKIKIVGVFTVSKVDDLYWSGDLSSYRDCLFIDYPSFIDSFVRTDSKLLSEVQWHYAFDYHKTTLKKYDSLKSAYEILTDIEKRNWNEVKFTAPLKGILDEYHKKAEEFRLGLLVLQIPILLMLAFYIFMVSQLIVDSDKNEIAVIKSRGGSSLQVFISYLVQSLILGVISILLGPLLSILLCKILGSSNGFMEFVQRSSLPVSLSPKVYIYSLIAVGFFIFTTLIPAVVFSRTNIVQHKQNKHRAKRVLGLARYFIDIILITLAGYGYYAYHTRQKTLQLTGVNAEKLDIDPMLFITTTVFILGFGMLFLRLYPFIIGFIFYIGRKFWSPVFYASFIQIGRSGGQEKFLMLFLILTLSIGIFNANASRTLNKNAEEKIMYHAGSDITLQGFWESNEFPAYVPVIGPRPETIDGNPLKYVEPPFAPFSQLKGIEKATKVLTRTGVTVEVNNKDVNDSNIMGIIPNEFGEVAWMRPNLLSPHWFHYLNLLVDGGPKAVLASKSFKDEHHANEGDSLLIKLGNQQYVEGYICAFIDYWPTFNPHSSNEKNFIIANLSYLNAFSDIRPYKVWMKKKPGTTTSKVIDDITAKGLQITEFNDCNSKLVEKKNESSLLGINSQSTLGFVVALLVSAMGFLIYWILSIKKRVLQFGIFRAMGMSLRKVIGIIIWEQILVSGSAIMVGIIIGNITSKLFVPMLQLGKDSMEQVPPFEVIGMTKDYVKLYIAVALMLIAGIAVLWRIITKIKIDQALKLGED